LATASDSASATDEPLPWMMYRAPWSMAAFNAFRLSAGLSLLSMGVTSNFTPAGLPAPLNFSAKNW
jgi:hypothetical protein